MEATSAEVEVKKLRVARYLERLNEARQNPSETVSYTHLTLPTR